MEIQIPKNKEYRLETTEAQKVKIMVTAGIAEICGQELLSEKWYSLGNTTTAIYTFTGAVIKMEGSCTLQYLAETSCFPRIFSYFDSIKAGSGTVFVVGKGRGTFCSTISNYFVRIQKKMDLVELDPSRGIVFPGTITYMQMSTIVDYHDGLKLSSPFCLYYGSTNIDNLDLYLAQVQRLQEEIEAKNTGNFTAVLCPDVPPDVLEMLLKKLKATGLVCIGDERMYHKLNVSVPKVFIENSGYVNDSNASKAISKYFNGVNGEYTPSSFLVKSECSVVRVGEQYAAPVSALPLGATRKIGNIDVCKCDPIKNTVLAISDAVVESQVALSPVLGFVVCLDDKKLKILCPQPKLPKCNYLLQGSLEYLEF